MIRYAPFEPGERFRRESSGATVSATTPEQEAQRGAEARRILESPVFIEAVNALDRELRMARERVPVKDTDMHTRLILAEQVQAKVLDYLRGLMLAGDAAELVLRDRESAAARMRDAMRHGLRWIG